MQRVILRYRLLLVQLSHLVLVAVSLVLAFMLRFDFVIPDDQWPLMYQGLAIAIPTKLILFHFAGLSRGWWRYLSILDLTRLLMANVGVSVAFTVATLVGVGRSFPRSIYILDCLLCMFVLAAIRLSVRLYFERAMRSRPSMGKRRRVLVYGAGKAAMTLLREVQTDPTLNYEAVGLLDDDAAKKGLSILGVPVLGPGRNLDSIADKLHRKNRSIDEIIIAMPSATRDEMQRALAHCRAANIPSKTIPSTAELLRGAVLATQIREVSITDLLGREPVQIDGCRIRESIAGRTVLVTGAAGSIGSELCRQLASFEPGRLVAFDQAESELFKFDLELRRLYPQLDILSIVGDIRDAATLNEVIAANGVEAVYHAAAYKHVPLMERFPLEAVHNNVIGTWNLVRAAYRHNVEKFVMISSDKAVKPSSIMGATKRLAELVLSAMPTDRTKFVSVRFGNVLGSNGSVVPIFQKQISEGGPVTVTHPEMRRYFMTIPEASQLVLVASTMGRGSEVFVLDMGEPVKIVDLARTMIRLSGKVPDQDVEIHFTGIRSGEKLFEEYTSGEGVLPTDHRKVMIFQGRRASRDLLDQGLPSLERLVDARNVVAVIALLKKLVPEFQPSMRGDHVEKVAATAGR